MAETKQAIEEVEEAVFDLDDISYEGDLTLVSSDGKEFTLPKKYACISKLVLTSLETDAEASTVPIPGVKAKDLQSIVEYMVHHSGTEPAIIPKPLASKNMKDVTKDPWDAAFIDRLGENRQQLYDLILASNYIDLRSLLHLGCAKVASLIKGQPLEKIKGILGPNSQQPTPTAPDHQQADVEAKA